MPESIEDLLRHQNIEFQAYDHPPVYTCEQARQALQGVGGVAVKNLLVRDPAHRFFLIVLPESKRVDLKALAQRLGLGKLSFANQAELMEVLGLTPGAVGLLALSRDQQARVRVLVDTEVWGNEPIHCHPLVNTKTLLIRPNDLERFITATGHRVELMNVPAKT